MSPATENLLKELTPFFEEKDFKLLKSKSSFVKSNDGLEFKIIIKFDGRGGLTMVDWLFAEVTIVDVAKICKKTMGFTIPIWFEKISCFNEDETMSLQIPTMYSRKALDIANDMNLKKLGELPFHEKYPPERIINCARVIEKLLIEKNVFQNFETEYNLFQEYEKYDDFLRNPKHTDKNGYNAMYFEDENGFSLNEVYFTYFLILLNKFKIPHSDLVKTQLAKLSDDTKRRLQKINIW